MTKTTYDLNTLATLETVLGALNPNADVCVHLASHTLYGIGETDHPMTMQDGCGNHRVMNWLDAIADLQLVRKFYVDSVEVEPMYGIYGEKGRVQWTITLINVKDKDTEALGYQANKRACMDIGLYL